MHTGKQLTQVTNKIEITISFYYTKLYYQCTTLKPTYDTSEGFLSWLSTSTFERKLQMCRMPYRMINFLQLIGTAQ